MSELPQLLDYAPRTRQPHRYALAWTIAIATTAGVLTSYAGFGAICFGPIVALIVGALCASLRHRRRTWLGILGVSLFIVTCCVGVPVQTYRDGYSNRLFAPDVRFTAIYLSGCLVAGLLGVLLASLRKSELSSEYDTLTTRGDIADDARMSDQRSNQ